MGAAITGLGAALPERVLDNATLASALDVDENWIVERTGIRERRIAAPEDSLQMLATAASTRALDAAGLTAEQVDTVVLATFTPDFRLPASAPLVAAALGATGAAAYDLNAGCAGFLYALAQATALVESGAARRVLVAGADLVSRVTDYTDARTCVLFGDGAGAVVVERSEEPRLGPFRLHADGSKPELLWIPPESGFIHMEGREVYRRAVDAMTRSVREIAAGAGLDLGDVDLVVAHQANERILRAVAERLGLADRQVVSNIASVGNTSAASIPLALAEAARRGVLSDDALVVLTAFGAGFAWGAGVVRWGTAVALPEVRDVGIDAQEVLDG